MKECGSCGVIKPLDQFHTQGERGFRSACRVCTREAQVGRDRGTFGVLPAQPTAEAHRVWMACDVAWGGERRMAA